MGTPQTLMNITSRVYVSVTLVGILSSGTSWNKLTGSMRTFRLPSIFIFTLDITLKYISVLGEMCATILTSVRLRSVGKNPQKAKALSGVLGTSFLKSGEMAEEMHAAMCCRGFTAESVESFLDIRTPVFFVKIITESRPFIGVFEFFAGRGKSQPVAFIKGIQFCQIFSFELIP